MKVTFDTNVIVRLLIADDAEQLSAATAILGSATVIFVPVVALCEAVWVMRRSYRLPMRDIADRLERLVEDERVKSEFDIAAAGFAMMRAGGDFADGVIAAQGYRLGGETFATFDRDAARLVEASGAAVTLLG